MSADKEKINQLAAKVEEISATLNKVQEELRSVSASLKILSVSQVSPPKPAATSAPAPAPKPPVTTAPKPSPAPATPSFESSKQRTVDDIRMSFPEDLESRLSFEEKGEYIIVKPTAFLGTNFAKVASAVRGMGGEYISAGKDSHFRVPKKKA
ncbi:MAG: hypothetical protein ACQCN6_05660 [Candidatus Bathyarchaeia archaeon]